MEFEKSGWANSHHHRHGSHVDIAVPMCRRLDLFEIRVIDVHLFIFLHQKWLWLLWNAIINMSMCVIRAPQSPLRTQKHTNVYKCVTATLNLICCNLRNLFRRWSTRSVYITLTLQSMDGTVAGCAFIPFAVGRKLNCDRFEKYFICLLHDFCQFSEMIANFANNNHLE